MILFWLSLAWFAGMVLGGFGLGAYWPVAGLVVGGFAIGSALGGRRRDALIVLLAGAAVVLGLLRYEVADRDRTSALAVFNDAGSVTLGGMVDGQPEERATSRRLTVRVEGYLDAGGNWQRIDGRVLVTTPLNPEYAYGDVITLTGELKAPPVFEDFDYREYLALRGIASLLAYPEIETVASGGGSDATRLLNGVRDGLAGGLEHSLREPEAALAKAILLGERSALPPDLTDSFNRSGISHLVAISGYNVMLLAGFGIGSLAWLTGRRPAILISVALILGYALLTGGSPSVLRAAAMGIVVLGASLAGRPRSSLNALALAASLLTAWQPLIVRDVAFQLSVAATLGIVLLASPFEDGLMRLLPSRLPSAAARPVASHLAVTAAATLSVLPIVAASFGRISLVALPANLLAAPFFPLILLSSLLTSLAGLIDAGLGRLVGEFGRLPLAWMIAVGESMASLPGSALQLRDVNTVEAAAGCAALAFGAWTLLRGYRRPAFDEPRLRLSAPLACAALLAPLALYTWLRLLTPSPAELRLTVLDVGQGDAILIETPAGQTILVDGGPSGSRLLRGLGAELGDERRIDLVVLSHAQEDHLNGLVPLLERYDVRAAMQGPLQSATAAYAAWRRGLEEEGVPLLVMTAGQRADLGDGAYLEVVGPPEGGVAGGDDPLNDNSLVLRLVYGRISFLLTGDIGAAGEQALLNSGFELQSTVLKVAHHGSDGSSSAEFLEAVGPEVAVVSAGADNPFGHPSPTTRLRLQGTPLLRTDEHGGVRFSSDGTNLRVEWQRERIENWPSAEEFGR